MFGNNTFTHFEGQIRISYINHVKFKHFYFAFNQFHSWLYNFFAISSLLKPPNVTFEATNIERLQTLNQTGLTLVSLSLADLFADVLYLKKQLDPLDGSDGRLGYRRGDSSSDEVLHEGHRIG